MIDHARKLIYIHIARTGGTSIEYALCGKDWWNIQPETKHLSAKQARKYYGDEIWNSYIKFSVIRNPWDRIVSMWATGWWHRNELAKNNSFEDFILGLQPHEHEVYNSLYYTEILNEDMNYILRFESLQSDFDEMLENLGCNKINLPHREVREHKHYKEFYDRNTEMLVRELFLKDILKYAYTF